MAVKKPVSNDRAGKSIEKVDKVVAKEKSIASQLHSDKKKPSSTRANIEPHVHPLDVIDIPKAFIQSERGLFNHVNAALRLSTESSQAKELKLRALEDCKHETQDKYFSDISIEYRSFYQDIIRRLVKSIQQLNGEYLYLDIPLYDLPKEPINNTEIADTESNTSVDIERLETVPKDELSVKKEFEKLPTFQAVIDALVAERKQQGYSIRGIANAAGLQKNQVERIEAGTNQKQELFDKYLSALGKTVTYNIN